MLGNLPVSGLTLELRNFQQYQQQIGQAEQKTATLGTTLGNVAAKSQNAGAAFRTLGVGMAALGAAAIAALWPMAKAAMEEERLIAVGDRAAATMGVTAAAMASERTELRGLDVDGADASKTLNALVIAQMDVAKASDIVSMAQDVAAYSGDKLTQVNEALTLAIASGNVRGLKQYGITVDADAAQASYAKSIGKTVKSLSDLEKRQAASNAVLSIGSRFAGLYEASLTKASGQISRFNVLAQQAGEALGRSLEPAIFSVTKAVNRLLDWFAKLPPSILAAITGVASVVAGLGALATTILVLSPMVTALATSLSALRGFLWKVGLATSLAAGEIAIFTTAAGVETEVMGPRGLTGAIGGVIRTLGALHPAVKIAIGAVALLGAVATAAVAADFGGLGKSFKKAIADIGTWGAASFELVKNFVLSPWKWVDAQIRKVTGRLSKDDYGFTFDVASFFLGGARIIAGFALGILEAIDRYVMPALYVLMDTVASYLIGRSPPEKGPLSKIDTGGVKLIQAWLQGMESVSLDAVQAIADEVSGKLTRALWFVTDAVFDIATQAHGLDAALWPFEDSLTRIQATADLITIPLGRQNRLLTSQLETVRVIAEEERKRAEMWLRALEKQTAQLEELAAADQARLAVVDHEIFMEELRNRILGRATSAKLITMQSTSKLLGAQVKQEEASAKTSREAEKVERERLEALTTAAEAQMATIQTQIDRLERVISLEMERVTWTEEELKLQQALQTESRLALLQETRFWDEESRQISHLLDIIGRLPAEAKAIAESAAKAAMEPLTQMLEDYGAAVAALPPVKPAFDRSAIDAAMKQLDAIFEPVRLKAYNMWAAFEPRWKKFVFEVELAWKEDPAVFISRLPGALITGLWAARLEWIKGLERLSADFEAWQERVGFGLRVWHAKTLNDTKDWLAKTDEAVAAWSVTTGETISVWCDKTGEDIEKWAVKAFRDIATWSLTSGGKIYAWRKKAGDDIEAWAIRTQNRIEEWRVQTLLAIDAWCLQAGADIAAWALQAGADIVNWVTEAAVKIPGKLDEFLEAINTWWESTGVGRIQALGAALVWHYITSAAQAIRDEADRIAGIGSSFVDGIKQGFESGWGRFTDWVNERIRGIIKSIQDAIGMGSPARETTPIGVAMAQGIEKGFTRQLNAWVARIQPQMRIAVAGLGGSVSGTEGARSSVVNQYYNYGATAGPTVNVAATYSRPQGPGSIRDDVALMLAVAG